jgi:hypothetical protein
MRRLLSAMVGVALMLSMTAGAAAAAAPSRLVTLTINTPDFVSGGTFVATGGVPCKSGTTTDIDGQFLGGDKVVHLVVWKQFTCANPSVMFVLKLDVYIPQPTSAGSHDFGSWVVDSASVPSLHGYGAFVGTYYGTDPYGIVDRLVGVMHC